MGGGREVGPPLERVCAGAHTFLCGGQLGIFVRPGGYFYAAAGRIFFRDGWADIRWNGQAPGRMEENMSRVGIIGGGAGRHDGRRGCGGERPGGAYFREK